MRIVRLATGLATALAIAACEPVIEPLADTTYEVPSPSFSVHNRVVQSVTGGGGFYWTQPSSGVEVWRTYSLNARKYADGSVTGTFQANYHGLWKDRGRIACFTIRGNEAWLGVVIESSTSPNPNRVNSERIIYMQDNGEGSNAAPDGSTALPPLGDFGSLDDYCMRAPLERPDIGVHELEAGNIQVFNPVVDISGSGGFTWTRPRTGEEFWLTSSVSARKQADGSVTGTYERIIHEFGWDKARITCFTIIGNEAWLGMIIEESTNPPSVGLGRALYLVDNGRRSDSEPDRSTGLPRLSSVGVETPEEYCQTTPENGGTSVYEFEEGDIQIGR